MRKFVIIDPMLIPPFNEPASELMVILNSEAPSPLNLHLTELVDSIIGSTSLEMHLSTIYDLKNELERPRYGLNPQDQIVVYRDNLFFDREFFEYFMREARKTGRPSRAVLPANDRAWIKYSVPLSSLVLEKDHPDDDDSEGYFALDLWYFPHGWAEPSEWAMVRVPSGEVEKGYYNVPDSMTNIKLEEQEAGGRSRLRREQDLTHYLTSRSCVPIQSWVHIFNANIPLGVFSRGNRFEEGLAVHNLMALKILIKAIWEQKQVVSCSEVVKVGQNCDIDPSAVILGPTTIGDNCKIGAGVVIDNCVIGDNVTLANGCNLMLSVVGNNCFLPFRAALFMTTLMDNTIVAQNTCLQMCVVGRNSFVGAGSTFTDFNLLPSPLRAMDAYGEMSEVGQPVIGGCVGHNVRVGAGMIIQPGRAIESDVILIPSPERRIINKFISFDMSDHHTLPASARAMHRRLYPRRVSMREEEMLEEW